MILTSRRPDGAWTWRAAGARQPKGVLAGELLPADAAIGDVLRVEAEIGIDGISVRQVLPPKMDKPPPPRVEHLGSQRFTEGVTGPRPPTGGERSAGGRRDDRRSRDHRGPRRDGPSGRSRPQRSGSAGRGARERPPRAPRLRAASAHRDAWLATLSPDQKAIAERLANEGIRAVRQSMQGPESAGTEEGAAVPEGRPDGPDVALVEELFSALRAADWRDRAEAAQGVCDDVDLRDLRSVVAGTPRHPADDEARALAAELRDKLAARVDREHSAWIADLGSLLRKGRSITALRVSQRPPKAGTPLPESLARSLRETAGAQLDGEADDDLWVRVLEAAAQSPIRLVLVAEEVPQEPTERLLRTVRRFGDRLPALREQFAIHLDAPAEPDTPAVDQPDAPDPVAVEPDESGEPAGADPAAAKADESDEPAGADLAAVEADEADESADSDLAAVEADEPADSDLAAVEADEPADSDIAADEAAEPAAPDLAADEAAEPAAPDLAAVDADEPDGGEPSADAGGDPDAPEEVLEPAGEVETA